MLVRSSVHVSKPPETSLPSLCNISRIVSRVYEQICDHAPYLDMKSLLEGNGLYNKDVQKLLANFIEELQNYIAFSPPPSNQRYLYLSLKSLANEVVYVDYFWLEDMCLFHVMGYLLACFFRSTCGHYSTLWCYCIVWEYVDLSILASKRNTKWPRFPITWAYLISRPV